MHGYLRWTEYSWMAGIVTVAFLFSQAYLNYVQSGNSYIPALAFFLLGFELLLQSGENLKGLDTDGKRSFQLSMGVGLALALALCFWLPFIVALPADWQRRFSFPRVLVHAVNPCSSTSCCRRP
jgi:hypothetical protein